MIPLDPSDLTPRTPPLCFACGRRHSPKRKCTAPPDNERVGPLAWIVGWALVIIVCVGIVHMLANLTH